MLLLSVLYAVGWVVVAVGAVVSVPIAVVTALVFASITAFAWATK